MDRKKCVLRLPRQIAKLTFHMHGLGHTTIAVLNDEARGMKSSEVLGEENHDFM